MDGLREQAGREERGQGQNEMFRNFVWSVVKLIILTARGQWSAFLSKNMYFDLSLTNAEKHGTDGTRGKISLLTDGKLEKISLFTDGKGGKIGPRLALILLLIGYEDSIVTLIGQNEPIVLRNNDEPEKCFSAAAGRLQQHENDPLVLFIEEKNQD